MFVDYDLYIIINWTIPLIGFLITLASQVYININYKIYKGHINAKNKTGYDAARAILDANNLNDIDIERLKTYTNSARYSRGINGYLAIGEPRAYEKEAAQLKETLSKNKILSLRREVEALTM